jgi:carbon-monoxide dehydrogenase small subunit
VNVDIEFRLNGVARRISVPAHVSTLDMLREQLGLTGTKYGCGEGECGACTIIVDGGTVNACLMLAAECHGREITTIEGVATTTLGARLMDSFVAHGAVQCGFCIPGMVVQASSLLERHPRGLTHAEVQRGIEGNLCRCTGYRKIIEAIEDVCQPQA